MDFREAIEYHHRIYSARSTKTAALRWAYRPQLAIMSLKSTRSTDFERALRRATQDCFSADRCRPRVFRSLQHHCEAEDRRTA
jgi:hypothetical protein